MCRRDRCYSNEILCDVSALNIDSASFTQIYEACGKDLGKTEQMILDIVNERGKMQNPVTGSGGMFIGTVKEIGEDLQGKIDLKVEMCIRDSNCPGGCGHCSRRAGKRRRRQNRKQFFPAVRGWRCV